MRHVERHSVHGSEESHYIEIPFMIHYIAGMHVCIDDHTPRAKIRAFSSPSGETIKRDPVSK